MMIVSNLGNNFFFEIYKINLSLPSSEHSRFPQLGADRNWYLTLWITLFAAKPISRSQTANFQDCLCWAPTISVTLSLPSCEHQIVLLLECAPFGNTLVPKAALPNRGYTLPTHDRSPQEAHLTDGEAGAERSTAYMHMRDHTRSLVALSASV